MKVTKLLAVVGLIGAFVLCFSHQTKSNKLIDKPTESWLMRPHEVITNPDGVVRSKGHALELAKVAMKYLFDADENIDVEPVGQYWIGYTIAPKPSNLPHNYERYFVKINKVSGGVEECGLFP